MKKNLQKQKGLVRQNFGQGGFTLIEILVVIGIIAILAVIVLIAINPGRQFAQSRNTQRTSNVNAILNAIGQRMADNKGVFSGASGCASAIPTSGVETITVGVSGSGLFDLSCLVPTYITAIPFDPSTGNASTTDYTIQADSNGRITVCAPKAANETTISGAAPICITR